MNKKQNNIDNNKESGEFITNRKSFLEELAYCPDYNEDVEIKRYYVSPDEINDIMNNLKNEDER